MGNTLKEDATDTVEGIDPRSDRCVECPSCESEDDVVEIATLQDGAYWRTDSRCLGCRLTFPTWW